MAFIRRYAQDHYLWVEEKEARQAEGEAELQPCDHHLSQLPGARNLGGPSMLGKAGLLYTHVNSHWMLLRWEKGEILGELSLLRQGQVLKRD